MFTPDLPTIPKIHEIHETTPETQITRSVNLANTITTSDQFYDKYIKDSSTLIADAKCARPSIAGSIVAETYGKCFEAKLVTPDEFENQTNDKLVGLSSLELQKLVEKILTEKKIDFNQEIPLQNKYYFVNKEINKLFDQSKPFVVYSIVVPKKDSAGKVIPEQFIQGYYLINIDDLSDPKAANGHQFTQIQNILIAALRESGEDTNIINTGDVYAEAGIANIDGETKSFKIYYDSKGQPMIVYHLPDFGDLINY